jgi:hypothetical protein
MLSRGKIIGAAFCAVGVLVAVWAAFAFVLPYIMAWIFVFLFDHDITGRERVILYRTDHKALATMLRDVATHQLWSFPKSPDDGIVLSSDNPSFPSALKRLKPSSVRISDEGTDLEFGGPFLHFGVSAFRPGLPGAGTKQLGDGLWFYSENGRYPKP